MGSLCLFSAIQANIKMPVHMSCTSTEAVCRELIFIAVCHYTAPVHTVMINRVSNVPGNSVTIFMSASVACILTNIPGHSGNLSELFFPPGNPRNLQGLLEIFWFSLRVCAVVVNISCNSCISECISTKYLR